MLSPLVEAAAGECGGDVDFLDVDGAAGDTPSPCVAQAAFHAEFLGVAVAAHELDGVSGDFACDFVGEAFGDAGFEDGGESVFGVGCGAVDEEACGFDAHGHVGEA